MLYLRTAWKNFRRMLGMNVINIMQLTAALLLTSVMISAITLSLRYYTPFKDYFDSNGLLVRFSATQAYIGDITSTFQVIETSEQLKEYLSENVETILPCHAPIGFPLSTERNDLLDAKLVSYEDKMLNCFHPELEKGRWLYPHANELEVVVSENDYGWTIGSVIALNMVNTEQSFNINAKVVGILKNRSRIVGWNTDGVDDIDYRVCYSSYDSGIDEKPLMIFSYSALKECNPQPMQGLFSTAFIRYSNETTEEELKNDSISLASMGALSVLNMNEVHSGTKQYIIGQMMNLLPIVIVLLTLVCISSVSSSALAIKRRLHDYAIYYIVGLQWKQCLIINLIQSSIVSITALLMSGIGLVILQFTSLKNLFRIEWNMYLWLSIGAVLLLQVAASVLIPLRILIKETPKQILTHERN